MRVHFIVDNVVINTVEQDTLDNPWNYEAVEHPDAGPGWVRVDGELQPPPAPAETYEEAVARINTEFEAEMKAIRAQYPPSEREGWARQEAEARAFLADPLAPTPVIDSMIAESGEDKTLIAQGIMAKVDAYSAYYGAALGRKRYKISQLTPPEE